MTVALGSSSAGAAQDSCQRNHNIYSKAFGSLLNSTQKLYSKLQLFSGWSPHGQNLEGKIIKDVMLEGIKEGIACLPVHDDVAVQQEHIEWAKEQLLASCDKITETTGLARVKVDLP